MDYRVDRFPGVEMTRIVLRVKRVRLTRSVMIDGRHVEKGTVLDLAKSLAEDLVMQDSAVQLTIFPRLFSRIRLFIASRVQKRERNDGSRRKSG
jgi:hypothetical protein